MTAKQNPETNPWVDCTVDDACAKNLAQAGSYPLWFARLLVNRGLNNHDAAESWLNPKLADLSDPFELPDMKVAVSRILQAIVHQERITIFGDYDVDGLTSVALLMDLFKAIGARVTPFLPHRLEEGYGLSMEALSRCIEETTPQLIITVDCGTGSVDAVFKAKEKGVDVIITDHHHTGEKLAPAMAVVNPRRLGDTRHHVLAGVGVAFKLAHALLKDARADNRFSAWSMYDPRELLDLVALGTVADIVPLKDENRIMVAYGLKKLNRTKRLGLKALIEVARPKGEIGVYEVGFLLGPRLNASGRLGTARMSLQLLTTSDPSEARKCAVELDAANRQRQMVEREMVDAIMLRIGETVGSRYAIVEADPDWHPGVVGIVASRLVQKYHRPAIVIGSDGQGRAKGSCRGVSGVHLVTALDGCADILVKYGGHAMAAGIEIEWDRVDEFTSQFAECVSRQLGGELPQKSLSLDGWLEAEEFCEDTVSWIEKLGPFGMGNPEPVWGCRGVKIVGEPREVGEGHLKTSFSLGRTIIEAIGFGLYGKPLSRSELEVAFQIKQDTFRGQTKTVMHLKDFRELT
ncbi:MAG TPA: single-stranded-DNA-specific exonuclease RecJ [Kiritimatiellia bacterium]|nr:single-stranded-DNA-specific exonuclease RecJ [Kiritimatiellia bacterium]